MTLEELKRIKALTDETYIEIEGEKFKNIEMVSIDFAVYFSNCIFENCVFNNNKVKSIDIQNCKFKNCEFKNLKDEEIYITIRKSTFEECDFKEIYIDSEEQTSMQGNRFEKCKFENLKLYFNAIELAVMVCNSIIKNCSIISAEIALECESSQLINSTIMGYILDSIFKNVKMIDTKIDGDFENNKCINCTLNGEEFVLENN